MGARADSNRHQQRVMQYLFQVQNLFRWATGIIYTLTGFHLCRLWEVAAFHNHCDPGCAIHCPSLLFLPAMWKWIDYALLIMLAKCVISVCQIVAGAGLEPATCWLWANRATNCSTPAYPADNLYEATGRFNEEAVNNQESMGNLYYLGMNCKH